jgi:hypothetical protein
VSNVDFGAIAAADLSKHLDKRIETVLRDYMDRCSEIGVSYERATVLAATVLGHYFVIASLGLSATEDEIIAACRWHFEQGKANENDRRKFASARKRRSSARV